MRWPAAWKNPALLSLLNATPVNCLVLDAGADLGAVADAAKQKGLAVTAGAPMGATLSKGVWPGIAIDTGGGASAGPTGVPWLDSNGWKIRLERALHAESECWIDAAPKPARVSPEAYAMAYMDAAAFGGRWVITLDEGTAAAIAGGTGTEHWNKLMGAARFFESRQEWADFEPEAVVGVVSDFAGENDFLGGEVLNLLARTNQQYRVIVKGKSTDRAWRGLRAILYVDAQPPSKELRQRIEELVKGGVLLIAGPKWGTVSGAPVRDQEHPRYEIRTVGKGRVAIAKAALDDPYLVANDSVVLVSHRHDLVRLFNAGSVNTLLTASRDRLSMVLHLLFYADRGPQDASVRIAGKYRFAQLRTPGTAAPRQLELQPSGLGAELHLPPMEQYAAVELEAGGGMNVLPIHA